MQLLIAGITQAVSQIITQPSPKKSVCKLQACFDNYDCQYGEGQCGHLGKFQWNNDIINQPS
ncbi:hypothetical protein D3C80_1986550 [compost metagenome]